MEYADIPALTFFVAGNLHLLQDSISKCGIKWLYPFRKTTISGDYSAFTQDERITSFVLALIVSNIAVFSLSYYVKNNFANLFLISTIFFPILFLVLSFVILFESCDARINS